MNGADTIPLRWCAICGEHYVREPTHSLCVLCHDDGLKVTALAPTPVKTGTPISSAMWPWGGAW